MDATFITVSVAKAEEKEGENKEEVVMQQALSVKIDVDAYYQ